MSQPFVSIIIVTYCSSTYIQACIDSLLQTSYTAKEIIVVDNHSQDNTLHILSKYKENLHVESLDQNIGYAGGVSKGIKIAKGEYICILNPDTLVAKGFLEPLVAKMESDSLCASCQPAVFLSSDPHKLNLTGKVTQYLGFDWITDYKSAHVPAIRQIYSWSGSAILLRHEALTETRGFDPIYFMYYEDSDLSWRFQLYGFTQWFIPESHVFHDYKFIPQEAQSLKKKIYYLERNRLMTVFKNYSVKTLLLIILPMMLMEMGMFFSCLMYGAFREKVKSYGDLWKLRSHIQTERKIIQSQRKIPDKEILRHFVLSIDFELFQNPVVRWIVNPILKGYGHVLRQLA